MNAAMGFGFGAMPQGQQQPQQQQSAWGALPVAAAPWVSPAMGFGFSPWQQQPMVPYPPQQQQPGLGGAGMGMAANPYLLAGASVPEGMDLYNPGGDAVEPEASGGSSGSSSGNVAGQYVLPGLSAATVPSSFNSLGYQQMGANAGEQRFDTMEDLQAAVYQRAMLQRMSGLYDDINF